ncbi:putative DNA binding domain-containing protein [Zhouia spongiae]|uniref:DNA binding domain-containing protein n=1 Tax=Zhouia spongiae TaxID=2202721 RepID=A0ABY3YNH0_9FLAO|nr:RNA-binding domain-containing protein [Zhouia spongiae]UNY99382.1 putative DNA binding domain-containing protein [Zhouia spongiae]
MPETNRIEYKRVLSDGLEKEVIAFLNYREGGILYIGIDKNENVYGLVDSDGDQLKIKDRLKNNIRPSALGLFDIVSEERECKDILKIIIASGPEKPYHLKKYGMSEKGCFIRMGSSAEPMSQKMIDELFAKRTRNSISKIKAGRQDLSFGQLKIYYEEAGYNLGKAFAKNLELLTEDGAFNYAGYLLADKNNTSIKVAKYSGKTRTDLIESNEYGHECLVKATKQVIDKIAVENRTNTKITAKERQQTNLWNPIALREAIINAFVHNDYTNEITPKFEIFADRIEITSAGGLPEGLSKQEFFEGFSVPRNKELMRIFKDLELVEQLGSGIPRILEHYGKESFSFSDNFLRMTFVAKETTIDEDGQVGGQKGGVIGGVIGGVTDAAIDAATILTKRQKEVLKLIAANPSITYNEIAEALSINESAVGKHITAIKNKGFLERHGDTRGYWEINLDKNK